MDNEKSGICPNSRKINMVAYNDKRAIAVGFAPRCKQWSCPVCGKIAAYQWRMRVRMGMYQLAWDGVEMRFLTLTSRGDLLADQTLYVWPVAWKKLRTRIQRAVEHDFYIAVPERQGNGNLHLHIIESWNLGTRWYKDNAVECGLGFMALEEETTTSIKASNYICKYLVKSIKDGDTWPPGFRRVRASQTWPVLAGLPEREYRFEKIDSIGDGYRQLSLAAMHGYEVSITDHKTAWQQLEPENLTIDNFDVTL